MCRPDERTVEARREGLIDALPEPEVQAYDFAEEDPA
jgi:hypothetical protein